MSELIRDSRRCGALGAARLAALLTVLLLCAFGWATLGHAQSTETPFGGFRHDSSQPINVTADSLEVRNADQIAVFMGTVRVEQGKIRMEADRLEVSYASGTTPEQGAIDRLSAIGDVVISSGQEGAQAQRAVYDVARGEITMTGSVLLLQGDENTLSGQRLRINLNAGTARMDGGRVGVQLQPRSLQDRDNRDGAQRQPDTLQNN